LERPLFLEHCLKYQKWYLSLIFLMVIGIIFVGNMKEEKPFFHGGESYAHLATAEKMGFDNVEIYPLYLITKIMPSVYFNLIPLVLTMISLLLLRYILQKRGFSLEFIFFFLLLLVLSPFFIKQATTISSATIFFFLFTLMFTLLMQSKRYLRYGVIFCTAVIPLIDQFSGLIVLFALLLYCFSLEKSERRPLWFGLGILLAVMVGSMIWLNTPFMQGPFHEQQLARDLISDLGGDSGISFFVLILGALGFILLWREKRIVLAPAYLSLPLLIPSYIYNTEAIFSLGMILIFFATEALIFFLNYKWQLPTLRQFTFFLLLLGIFFSSLAFISRLSDVGPTAQDREVLRWANENLPSEKIIASFPEDADYVSYFTKKPVFFTFHDQNKLREIDSAAIFNAVYVHQLFPILENNGIAYIYISENAKKKMSSEQGLLFLLKNERFKLAYSAGEAEIWEFE